MQKSTSGIWISNVFKRGIIYFLFTYLINRYNLTAVDCNINVISYNKQFVDDLIFRLNSLSVSLSKKKTDIYCIYYVDILKINIRRSV